MEVSGKGCRQDGCRMFYGTCVSKNHLGKNISLIKVSVSAYQIYTTK